MTSLNRFTHYQHNGGPFSAPVPKMDANSFWHGVDTGKGQTNEFSESEEDAGGYDSQNEEGQIYEATQASLQDTPTVGLKRKADSSIEPTIDHIKRMATEDSELAKRVKAFYDELLEEKRKLLGDEMSWQANDEESNKAAMLAGNINVIMQARKALMSKDDEGVTIIIESGGWDDDAHIRPKYSITIKRVLQ